MTAALIVAMVLVGGSLSAWLSSADRKREAREETRKAEIRAERVRAHAANVAGFGVLGKEANR